MSTAVGEPEVEAGLARAETAVAGLVGLGLDACADEDILPLWQRLEVLSRMLVSVEQAVIAQAQARHLAFLNGAKTITVLARSVLHISAADAHQRIKAAEACGPRFGISGEAILRHYGGACRKPPNALYVEGGRGVFAPLLLYHRAARRLLFS